MNYMQQRKINHLRINYLSIVSDLNAIFKMEQLNQFYIPQRLKIPEICPEIISECFIFLENIIYLVQKQFRMIDCSQQTKIIEFIQIFITSIIIIFNIIFINMQILIPNCINNNNCYKVCNHTTCKAMPFMCNNQLCQCYSLHQACTIKIAWNNIQQLFSNKVKNTFVQQKYFQQIEDLYKNALYQIEKAFTQMKQISQVFKLSKLQNVVYEKLKQRKFSDLSGQLMSKLVAELSIQKNQQYKIRSVEKKLKQQIQSHTSNLVKMLRSLNNTKTYSMTKLSKKSFGIQSRITQDFETIANFFPNKNINQLNLLYRASENDFQVNEFWNKCNGKKDTLTLIKTQFGKVIGGYTPLAWKKNLDEYQKDESKQSFIFSITNKEKLNLIEGKQEFAIFHHNDCGPAFGSSDIAIADKANQYNSTNFANVGFSYNNDEYDQDSQSWEKFSGQSSGDCFRIEQWEVYEIIFS